MAIGGLWGGRSAHEKRRSRSDHGSRASTRRRRSRDDGEEGEVPEMKKPDVEELREKRREYYSISASGRRRTTSKLASALDPKASRATLRSSTSRHSRRTSSKTSVRSSTLSERRHTTSRSSARSAASSDRRRTPHHGTRSPRSKTSNKQKTRSEEYVYQSTSAAELRSDDEDLGDERPRPSSKLDDVVAPPLPTVFESEVTPDDSISQVGRSRSSDRRSTRGQVRPSLRRSNTTSTKLPALAEEHEETRTRSTSKRSSRRDPSILESIFPRRHSSTSIPTLPRLVDCLTCGADDVPSSRSAKLACGHRMCHDCLRRIFELSVKDPAHMPPKCCTEQHIPLKHVDKLFDVKFKTVWNRKYQEYHTKNRIYCPTPKCGEWIKPSHIHMGTQGRYAQCARCKTKVCTLCNHKLHKSRDCPQDPEIEKLVAQAKEKGWQRCYNCAAMVELKEGCNHMTCRCTAEFCMVCSAKWKTCDCPWFNYSNLPNPDRLNDWRVPEPVQVLYRQVFRAAVNPAAAVPPPAQPAAPNGADAARAWDRDQRRSSQQQYPVNTYQQEQEQRRRQERLDADLARRLQLASLMDPDDPNDNLARPGREHRATWGLGNAAGHFMNDDFVQNAANVVMDAFGDSQFGRRGERGSGRRRRARQSESQNVSGLAPGFLGDESVLDAGPA